MPHVDPIMTNFTAGEFSPHLKGRVDINKYFNGAETLENAFVRAYGGAYRRPGTYFVAEVKDSSKAVRLIPFQFSTEQAYIIEMGHEYMRFYKDDGQIYSGGVPYEIATPYQEEDLFDVQFAQSADVLYLAHSGYQPRKLSRTGHTAWSLDTITMEFGPFQDANTDEDNRMYIGGATEGNTYALQFDKDTLTSDMVGEFIRYDEEVVATDEQGYVQIVTVTGPKTGTALVVSELKSSGWNDDWAFGAWSTRLGWPSCVTFYEQRLAWANSPEFPQTVWLSESLIYEGHQGGSDDTDACIYTIASDQVNAIRWMISEKVLVMGTSGGGWTLSSGSTNEPLTPSNVIVDNESTFGSATVAPMRIGSFTYYVQRNSRTVREFSYSFDIDAYKALDMTVLAEHVTEGGVVDMAYQQSPNNTIWAVTGDGILAAMTREADHQVIAWHRHVTDGLFESVATIPRDEEDQVWVVVNRTIGTDTKRFVEYFKEFNMPDDQEDCFYVDSGLSYDGIPVTALAGMSHLAGETVSILADGSPRPDQVVATDGTITLETEASVVHIGLPFTTKVETLNLEAGAARGTAQGKIKRAHEAVCRLYRTLGCQFGVTGNLETVLFRKSSDAMDEPVPLYTGDKRITFPAGYDRDLKILFQQSQPLPMNILAVMPRVVVFE